MAIGAEVPPSGPKAESRFPPLVLPAGFQATLFACDPFVEYPSVIAGGPRPGALFVAVDYMTALGTDIVRRDEIRLLEDLDADGYADRSTVVVAGFNSIEGLAYADQTLFVMHAPFLTAVRLDDKGGVAERKDLLTGLGLPPEENPVRLHCANGVVVGQDGWLYLALGDHGCDVKRPEGDRLVFNGGGILRCRPDGADLHVFATGLRNIYDIALDDKLNVLLRDNENDGGTYKIRLYHSFFGADHGYPYLYDTHPEEAVTPLADLGLGSTAGGLCYLATQFPAEYRGNMFWCEWGRGVVRYPLKPSGSSFAPVEQLDFAVGADNDPYPFKPTDLVVDHDGAMFVSDWCDGQRPNRGRGRIYRIAHKNVTASISDPNLQQIQHAARLIWAIARSGAGDSVDELFKIAEWKNKAEIRAQAVRALGDLIDPDLVRHKLDAGSGDVKHAERLAKLADGAEPPLLLEIIVALGRLRWKGFADWLPKHFEKPDAALSHAAMFALRQADKWQTVATWLDKPADHPLRRLAMTALAERYHADAVSQLIARMLNDRDASLRRECAELLARVYKKPGPWVYWGFRPGPRPANTVIWEETPAIARAFDRALGDKDTTVRLAVLKAMQREQIPVDPGELAEWPADQIDSATVAVMLESLTDPASVDARKVLINFVNGEKFAVENRLRALTLWAKGIDPKSDDPALLAAIAERLGDGPVAAAALRAAARYPQELTPVASAKLKSTDPDVLAAAIEILAERKAAEAPTAALRLLEHTDPRVRQSAAAAAGKLGERQAVEPLLKLTSDADIGVRRAALDALRKLREPKAVAAAVAALTDRELTTTALVVLGQLGGLEHLPSVVAAAKRDPSFEVVNAAVDTIDTWRERIFLTRDLMATPAEFEQCNHAVAEIAGVVGVPPRWEILGPFFNDDADKHVAEFDWDSPWNGNPIAGDTSTTGSEGKISFRALSGQTFIGRTDVATEQAFDVDFQASSSGTLDVWLNGKLIYKRDRAGTYRLDSDRFNGRFHAGHNRLLVKLEAAGNEPEFHLRFRRKSNKAEHEKLLQEALTRTGDVERGRKLFANAEKSQCAKCHRIDEVGERIGPELSNVGGRFSRTYVVESILDPNLTIAPSFETLAAELNDGRTVIGVKLAETPAKLTLADNQGRKHEIAKSDIDNVAPQRTSTMPEGLEKRLTVQEFVDLTVYLMSRKGAATSAR